MFNGNRLSVARMRRKLTKRRLSELSGVSPVTLTRLENNEQDPEEETVEKLSKVLKFPEGFFFLNDIDCLTQEAASFRSLSKITSLERNAALSAGSLAFEVMDWVTEKFCLPDTDFPEFREDLNPEVAARSLREFWGLGEAPISDMIKLLEAKGVRIFSLSENTNSVDAFSCWRNDTPYVFLNNFKTAERSRFDSAHELGHLVMHQHGDFKHSKDAEREADRFASSFLMPSSDVRAVLPVVTSVDSILKAKKRWKVSAKALVYRLHNLEIISDWQNRTYNIELGRRGYGKGEPDGIEREKSVVWYKIFSELWNVKLVRDDIASDLMISVNELNNLVFGLLGEVDNKVVKGRHLKVV